MGKNKKNKKKKKSKNAQYDQASPHTEARGPKAKGKKRQHSPYNSQPHGTCNDSNLQSQRGQINTSVSDETYLSSYEEAGPKRQKCVIENDQSTERTIGQTSNAGTSQLGNFSGSNQVIPQASGSGEIFVGVNPISAAGQYQNLVNVHGYGGGGQNLGNLLVHLFWSVNPGNINYVLGDIPHRQLNMLNEQQVQSYIQWIVETTICGSITPVQGLYLCVLLGHLMRLRAFQGLQLPQSEETKRAFDMLLGCLANCAKYRDFNIFRYSSRSLEHIPYVLVMNSSYPGWLTFAAHFYPFCNMQRLLQQKILSTNYDMKKYLELLWFLLPNVEKVSGRNEFDLRNFLKRVFQSAPEGNLLFELCEDKHMRRFFRKEDERQTFFTECYLDRLSSSENNAYIGEILKKLLIIPEKCRRLIWKRLYDYLSEFARSHVSPTDEDVKAFSSIVQSLHLPKEQIYEILKFLSESTSTPRQDIVLQFLSDAKFDGKWKSVHFKGKVEIGKSWLITRLQNERKVLTAYRVLKELTSCQLVCKYQQHLTSELLDFVRKWLFDNVAHESIIAELGKINNIDDLLPNARKSFFTLVNDVLRKDLNLVNNKEILNQFFNSSLRTRLFSCVLDVLDVPKHNKQSLPNEKDFVTMLNYCEIWISLLRAEGL